MWKTVGKYVDINTPHGHDIIHVYINTFIQTK